MKEVAMWGSERHFSDDTCSADVYHLGFVNIFLLAEDDYHMHVVCSRIKSTSLCCKKKLTPELHI
jgi:hypothetical protein